MRIVRSNTTRPWIMGLMACVIVLIVGCVGQASAATGVWQVRSILAPAHFSPNGGGGELIEIVTNLGDEPISLSEANPMSVNVELPAGVIAKHFTYNKETMFEFDHFEAPVFACELTTLTCQASSGTLYPYESTEVLVTIAVPPNAGSLKSRVTVSGGGLKSVSSEEPLPVESGPVKFGVERFEQVPLNEDGSVDTQAGSHPFQFTTTLGVNQGVAGSTLSPVGMPKELSFDLPPGLVGNPTIMPQCPLEKFQLYHSGTSDCPPNTAVGVVSVVVSLNGLSFGSTYSHPEILLMPVYNLVPFPGEPARFGFVVAGIGAPVPVFLDTSVRTGSDYGVVVTVHNITQETWTLGSQLSFWGDPADPRHSISRGNCVKEDSGSICEPETISGQEVPFLTLPTSCTGLSDPLTASMEASSWEEPSVHDSAEYALHDSSGDPLGLGGCNRLGFEPSVNVAPDTQNGSTATGLTVGIHVSQQASLNPSGLAGATVKDTTVTLPPGVALNPAAADGLESCSEEQLALHSASVPTCPDAGKIGTVEIDTPLLPNPLVGAAYLAAQNANPFGSLVAMYIVAQDPVSGVLVKFAGEVKLDPITGQIVSTFNDTPQLPFEDLRLHFFGGSRAPLGTPSACGAYTTAASITPWSGNAPVDSISTFDVNSGPNGSACAAPLPFAPSLAAGSTNLQAGAFSPFTMTMSRPDGQQNLQSVQLEMPPGLLGTLSKVALCGEPQADQGTCGPESEIGETTVSVGLGDSPFSVKGGKVFITGPYDGAPYGLSIVNPAKAGPFDLGQVIVRAKIEVDPITAALTITTDNTGPYKIPTILDGIPLQIQHVNVTITRPGFTFNPTNCNPMSIGGSLTSAEGSSSALKVPFQVTNCATLAFKPKLTVSTSGRTSRKNGASLHVKLTYPEGPYDANISKVKVDLPRQLPSRLTTLQKACPAQTFNANPANCPPASIVGHAHATTPVLPVALEGPAYFVSYAGLKFPELVIVLSGYGTTVNLHAETFISPNGVTSSTFRTIPDVPVGTFELTLPQGRYSALAANTNLCKTTLKMPTAFTGQNGAQINQTTPITTTGCPKKKTKKTFKLGRASKGHKGSTPRKKK